MAKKREKKKQMQIHTQRSIGNSGSTSVCVRYILYLMKALARGQE